MTDRSQKEKKSPIPISPPYSGSSSPDETADAQTTVPVNETPISRLTIRDSDNKVTDDPDDASKNRYSVASHTLRITKFGYAIDPIELKYQEVIKNLSPKARRSSDISFDSNHIGHRILSLIRGFWSQAAFPSGTLAKPKTHTTVTSISTSFKQIPLYPHKETYGSLSKSKVVQTPGAKDKFNGTKTPVSPSIRFTKKKLPEVEPVNNPPKGSPPKKQTSYHSWIPHNKERISALITRLCQKMEVIFSKESRILNITSPCFVLGDIHGNLTDLRTYERSLWPKAPKCVSSNSLFLGDYVDRGEYSVECVLYLFAMKSIAPNKFLMLRGNHEVAAIQRQYTFSKECEAKFGPAGKELWRVFNKVFDRMPVAAVIDDQIFCAHGGIPRTISDIKTLAKGIPTPLDNPETQSPSAWEILWNDPITDSELIGMIEMDNAVVTQTQTIQTSPASNGSGMVTTTTSSTAISSDVPAPSQTSLARDQDQPSTPSPGTTNALSQADSILSREPANVLSFYMKPFDNQTETGIGKQAPAINASSNDKALVDGANNDDDNTLRRVPSDTSSIASATAQQMVNDGFVANIKRGTAYLFSDKAVKSFLKANNLSHVIRAHEVIPTGFAFHGDGRVITIFSSSKYCGLNNQAACAFISDDRIRILRLDTGDAGE